MLHVALLFTFYLGPKARFDILCTGFTWFLTSQLAASRPPGRLRRLSIQESLANVRKKEFLHNSKAEHTKWHTKCHRCTDLPDDWGWRLRMSVSWDKEYYDVRKHVFCFALGHILLNLSPANCHLFAALNIRKVRFWPKKSSSGWHTWNLVISTAQLDFPWKNRESFDSSHAWFMSWWQPFLHKWGHFHVTQKHGVCWQIFHISPIFPEILIP